jgi:anti-sigma regulatory factor (Ser/Thr protein kinase)
MNERIVAAPRRSDGTPCPRDAARVGVLRRIAAAELKHRGLDAVIGDALLISSELLTNALLHSGTTEITLNLAVRGGCLRITVIDGMPGRAERRKVDDEAETGRGLGLVEALAEQSGGAWGTSEDGAATWCSLRVPPGSGSDAAGHRADARPAAPSTTPGTARKPVRHGAVP